MRLSVLFLSLAACGGATLSDFDGDGSIDSADCAPEDPNIHPAATEACDDGIDNDCDNWTDCADVECSVLAECGSGDDDDLVVGDDDTSGDDDSAGDDDDDSSGDDDDSAGDDDDTSGDDDDSAGSFLTNITPQGITMIALSSGTFEMGCTAAQQTSTLCEIDEIPSHQVTLTRDFWLSETEITQGQWQSIMGTNPNPSHFGPNGSGTNCGADCPVESVNWWEALSFANYLSEAEELDVCYVLSNCSGASIGEGHLDPSAAMNCDDVTVNSPTGSPYDCAGYRLPTEAEWEYAARAGTDYLFAGSDNIADVSWSLSNSTGTTHPVRTKLGNSWRLFDMTGNVNEWVWDWQNEDWYAISPDSDPLGPASASSTPARRGMRGGGWGRGTHPTESMARVSSRNEGAPHGIWSDVGIRIARTVPVDADGDGVNRNEDCDDGDAMVGVCWVSVTAGGEHSCALSSNGNVQCWGADQHDQSTPPLGAFVAVSAGAGSSCGINALGSVICWGFDGYNEVSAAPSGNFVQVSGGANHNCGVDTSGAVHCWGHNGHGQTSSVPSGSFSQVSSGYLHVCAVGSTGVVQCWGNNESGQASAPATTFTEVSAGYEHSCGIRTDGELECWGANLNGESSPPTGVFLQVSAGYEYSCAVDSNNEVRCWGNNRNGMVTDIPPGTFTQIEAGGYHSNSHACVVDPQGAIHCWGSNALGQSTPP